MLKLVDGPCEGAYMCKRAPVFLRAVKDKDGQMDVLDLIEDTPAEGESVYVYQLEGEAGTVHLNFGGGKGGWYALGTYRYLPDVDGEELRDNAVWQKWALEHADFKIACPVDGKVCDKVIKACCSCPRNH